MRNLYLIASIAAVAFFTTAQHQGWAVYSGQGRQQYASSGGGGSGGGFNRSSTISHK